MTDERPLSGVADGNLIDRRRVIAAGASALTMSLAGCQAAVDFLADFVLEDVNVVNGSDHPVDGSIRVIGPGGSELLDDDFHLEPEDDADDADEESGAGFSSVFEDAGGYVVHVALDDPIGPRERERSGDDPADTAGNESPSEGNESGGDTSAGGDEERQTAGPEVEVAVDVDDPDEEHVVVIVDDARDEPIEVVVIEAFSDLADYLEG